MTILVVVLFLSFEEIKRFELVDNQLSQKNESSALRKMIEILSKGDIEESYLVAGQAMEDFMLSNETNTFPEITEIINNNATKVSNEEWEEGVNNLIRSLLIVNRDLGVKDARAEKNSYYFTLIKILLFLGSLMTITFWLQTREKYRHLKNKNSEIKKLRSENKHIRIKQSTINIFDNAEDIPIVVLNDNGLIHWCNKCLLQ